MKNLSELMNAGVLEEMREEGFISEKRNRNTFSIFSCHIKIYLCFVLVFNMFLLILDIEEGSGKDRNIVEKH